MHATGNETLKEARGTLSQLAAQGAPVPGHFAFLSGPWMLLTERQEGATMLRQLSQFHSGVLPIVLVAPGTVLEGGRPQRQSRHSTQSAPGSCPGGGWHPTPQQAGLGDAEDDFEDSLEREALSQALRESMMAHHAAGDLMGGVTGHTTAAADKERNDMAEAVRASLAATGRAPAQLSALEQEHLTAALMASRELHQGTSPPAQAPRYADEERQLREAMAAREALQRQMEEERSQLEQMRQERLQEEARAHHAQAQREREERRRDRAKDQAAEYERTRLRAAASERPSGTVSSSSQGVSFAQIQGEVKAQIASINSIRDDTERRKRVRQLRLRWHPDKNPLLTSLAVEVSKMINVELDDR